MFHGELQQLRGPRQLSVRAAQSLSSWKRVVNPDNIPIKDFSVQFRARQTRLAELEHTAKVPTLCRSEC